MAAPAYQASTIALLKHLQKRGPMTVHQISKLKSDSTTSPERRVASLVKRGTVARIGREQPARYEITRKGREAIEAAGTGRGLAPRNLGAVARPVAEPTLALTPPPMSRISDESYKPTELQPFDGRPGAMDAFALPSRMGRVLVYRDGRREHENGSGNS